MSLRSLHALPRQKWQRWLGLCSSHGFDSQHEREQPCYCEGLGFWFSLAANTKPGLPPFRKLRCEAVSKLCQDVKEQLRIMKSLVKTSQFVIVEPELKRRGAFSIISLRMHHCFILLPFRWTPLYIFVSNDVSPVFAMASRTSLSRETACWAWLRTRWTLNLLTCILCWKSWGRRLYNEKPKANLMKMRLTSWHPGPVQGWDLNE